MAVFRTIVAAVDFSETSGEALRTACELATDSGGELHLLHVVPDVRERFGAIENTGQTFHDLQQEWIDRAKACLAPLAQDARCQVVRSTVVASQPAEAIARYADAHHADLIVLGTHGYGPVRRWLLGSVSDRVLRLANRPVLTVPPRAARREQQVLSEVDTQLSR